MKNHNGNAGSFLCKATVFKGQTYLNYFSNILNILDLYCGMSAECNRDHASLLAQLTALATQSFHRQNCAAGKQLACPKNCICSKKEKRETDGAGSPVPSNLSYKNRRTAPQLTPS